jgi:hypothetical protein
VFENYTTHLSLESLIKLTTSRAGSGSSCLRLLKFSTIAKHVKYWKLSNHYIGMHRILFEYGREEHSIAKTNNQIVNNFIIATRASNVYVKEIMHKRCLYQ